jgi:hypothetical protein
VIQVDSRAVKDAMNGENTFKSRGWASGFGPPGPSFMGLSLQWAERCPYPISPPRRQAL